MCQLRYSQKVRHPAPGEGTAETATCTTSTAFGLKNLSDFGANSKLLKASGEGRASWLVKLVRMPWLEATQP